MPPAAHDDSRSDGDRNADRALGRLEGIVDIHTTQLSEIKDAQADTNEKLSQIVAVMNGAKGSWKTLVALGTIGAAVAEALHWLFETLKK